MKLNLLATMMIGALALVAAQASAEEQAAVSGPVYELRTYTTHEGRLPALHERFRNHTMQLFEKHGMENVMYWTPTDPKLADNTLIYVLRHDSMEAAKKSWEGFRSDPDWLKAKAASEKDAPILVKVESVFMKTTEYSPPAK